MLVVDASIVVHLAIHGERPRALSDEVLIGPPLLWSEATSAIHELAFRGDITVDAAVAAIARLTDLGIERRQDPGLHIEASRVARQLGWAKTYDAEYIALTRLTQCRLLTRDARLRRGAGRLIDVVEPSDLQGRGPADP